MTLGVRGKQLAERKTGGGTIQRGNLPRSGSGCNDVSWGRPQTNNVTGDGTGLWREIQPLGIHSEGRLVPLPRFVSQKLVFLGENLIT